MDFIGKNCPVCETAFKEEDDVVVCPKCGAPYHRDCYKQNGKCIFPELHKEKKSWKEEYCPEEEKADDDDDSNNVIVCRTCGHKNSKDSIVCEKCGDFLTGPSMFNPYFDDDDSDDDSTDEDDELEKLREQMRNVGPVMGSANFYVNGASPFRFDINDNEDYDGVTSRELVDYVGANALYYLPVFSKLKRLNTGRFNFAAFLFNGAWYIYRKQYLKGIIISLISMCLYVLQTIVTSLEAFSNLWEKANTALNAAERMPTYTEYFSWMHNNCSINEILIMFLPYIISFISFGVMILCGFLANKGYYKKAIKNIKAVKEEQPELTGRKLGEALARKGGINLGAAFCLVSCEAVITLAIMFFFS